MDQGALEQVQREHGDFLVLAVGAGQVAVLAVEHRPVGGVPLLDDLQALVDLAAQRRAGEVVADSVESDLSS